MMSTAMHASPALLALGLCLMGLPAPAFSQDTAGAGTVSGTVVSAAGAPEPAVTVCLTGTMRCALTDDRGHFRLADVRPGAYPIELTPPGGSRISGGKVEVRAGLDTQVALTLPAASTLRENVTVTAS